MSEVRGVLLQHMPEEVAKELDRRYGLVVGNGSVTVHKKDGEPISYEHTDHGSVKQARLRAS